MDAVTTTQVAGTGFVMADPSPSPTTVEIDPARIEYVVDLISQDIAAVVIGLFLILLIAIILTRAIVKAGLLPPPATLVTALSVLTLLSIAGGITTNNDEAWAIAAAGIGALAGSVSTVYQNTTDERLRAVEAQQQPKEAKDDEPGPGQAGDDSVSQDG